MKNYLKKLQVAKQRLDGVIEMTESELKDKIEFDDYFIFYQPSDGFVLVYNSHNAPLRKCIPIIKRKGKLSLEDYMDECI